MTKIAFTSRLQPAFGQTGQSVRAKMVSLVSLLYHNIIYKTLANKSPFEHGMIIVSIDVDVGSAELGLINKGKNDPNISHKHSEWKIGQIEENVFPIVLEFFNAIEIPVTIALRGQLAEVNTSIVDLIHDSPIRHDVGAHGYYHKRFTEMSADEAESELNKVSKAMKAFQIRPKTFIFPRNMVAHLELIRKFGYTCYRDCGGLLRDGMYIKKVDGLYDVHPSLYVTQHSSPLLLRRLVEISFEKKLPFHLWFHCLDFGMNQREMRANISRVLSPIFEHAKGKGRTNGLSFETMLSATMCAGVIA